MTKVGDGRYNTGDQTDLIAMIADLAKRLDRLERTPQAGATSVDSGTFVVNDASGVRQVELGLLSDGSYGLNVKEPSGSFHQVPYVYASTILTGEVCSSNVYGDLATVGPSVTVLVRSSGRILIIASAQVQWIVPAAVATTGDGRFDVAFTGANTRVPNEVVDPIVGQATQSIAVAAQSTSSYATALTMQAVFENLNPGATTFTMKYARSSSATADPTIFRRTITVFAL
jgi:hypothetical protein